MNTEKASARSHQPVIRGVVTYRIRADGCLVGEWIAEVDGDTDGQLGHEFATPLNSEDVSGGIAGTYHVELRNRPGKQVYDGELRIERVGPSYRLFWRSPEASQGNFDGVGILSGVELHAAYWRGTT